MSEQTPEPQRSSSGFAVAVGVDVTHPDREYTPEEQAHLAVGPQPVAPAPAPADAPQTQVAVAVTHPDRPLTPEEREHLGLPPENEENDQ